MDDYPLIADHGLIGDLQTAALVATDGSVDWFCAPRFDSGSIFGALLDARNGGRLRVHPLEDAFNTKQLYFPGTAILITRFMTEAGVGEVVDFMPVVSGSVPTSRHRLVRIVRCVRGQMRFGLEISPRFDYGRQPHEVHVTEHGAVFTTADAAATVHLVREPSDDRLANLVRTTDDGDLEAVATLSAGQARGLVLETGVAGPPLEIRPAEVLRLLDDTVHFWRSWLARSTYTGRWREHLMRSAITLKLMTFAPSGGLVAAPTAGLPEQIGGERNWDYRFTWVRDSSFSVYALLRLGFVEEAAGFSTWLRDRVLEQSGSSGPLNIMYRVDGSSDLTEEILPHWEGYRGSSPVRIGNGAADQLQLDIYGEAMDSLYLADQHGIQAGHIGWQAILQVLDWLCDNWDQADEGIWETRGGRKDFTYGRVMSWVAFDRGIRLATAHGRPAPLDRWRAQRDAVYEQVMTRGWSDERRAFVQEYGGRVLDSSLLRMSDLGFVTPTDPMWASTLRAMDRELVADSLVYRYDPEASPDGLRGSEGTFSLCTFNYVDALARAGRLDEAQLVFEKMLTYANHLGLYSEEIALTGEQIGNFPQAFTHLALIAAALTLDANLELRGRRPDGYRLDLPQLRRQPTTSGTSSASDAGLTHAG
jgi:GH15 family glucan-1,4-alpha-glucosidase